MYIRYIKYTIHIRLSIINAVYKCNIISRSISLIFGRCYGNEIILYVYNYVLYIIICIVHLYVYGITMYNIMYAVSIFPGRLNIILYRRRLTGGTDE